MLTVERVKELVNDRSLTDEEIKEIRDEFYVLAEIIFEQLKAERETSSQQSEENELSVDKLV